MTSETGIIRRAAIIALLCASALASLGRVRAALALTLGASLAIVSAFWLSNLVGRFAAPRRSATAGFDWKFGLNAALRYALVGAGLYGAVRALPGEIPWLVTGLSMVVASVSVEGILEFRRQS